MTSKGKDAESKRKSAGGDRLLPGENPGSRQPEDADHWLAVYTELLQAKAAMLAALNERLTEMRQEVARREIGSTDAPLLESELARFQQRIDFWLKRKTEL